MGGRRRRTGLRIGILLFILAAALFVLFAVERDPSPTSRLLAAEQYFNLAREAQADIDAPETYESARRSLRSARSTMMRQFGRPAFLRSYAETRRLIQKGHELTAQSMQEARTEATNRQSRIQEAIVQIRSEAAEVRAFLLHLPPRYHRALRHVVAAEARIAGAEAKLSATEGRAALEQMDIARAEVSLALRDVRELLVDFLDRRSEWEADLNATLEWSRRNDGVAIIVDKLNHRTHLVRGGRSIKSYSSEFGPRWLDRKLQAGDQATPEGRYKVVKEKGWGQTRYHRALLIDYPNDADRRRFRNLSSSGMLSRRAGIGGLIEIHGEGGKGEDWTLGCVSLRNHEVDELCKHVAVGTPVTIVGLWDEPGWLDRLLQTANR